MTDKQIEQFNKMREALFFISNNYMSSSRLKVRSKKLYGLPPEECLERAYDNIRAEAKEALKGIEPIDVSAGELDNQYQESAVSSLQMKWDDLTKKATICRNGLVLELTLSSFKEANSLNDFVTEVERAACEKELKNVGEQIELMFMRKLSK